MNKSTTILTIIAVATSSAGCTINRTESNPRQESKMTFQGLRTAVYAAPDLDKAKQWYTKVLGVAPYFDEPFYVGFNVAGYELALDPDAKVGEGVTTYWGVEDVEKEHERLIKLGATPYKPVQEVGGGIKVAAIKDPFGNVFGIIYNPHFKLP